MISIPNYTITVKLYESDCSLIVRAQRNSDKKPVILKILKGDHPAPAKLANYRREFELVNSLDIDGVIRVYGLEKYENALIIIQEDFGAYSLDVLQIKKSVNLKTFLTIAIRIVDILGCIHQQNVIHKDINPSNIVFNPKTGMLKIIDFGVSTRLPHENQTIKYPKVLEGTLPYISPEQTGRMNRDIDYRSDFYSLGITFYELLTGRLPFETEDALEMAHCHIARKPPALTKINPDIPRTIADIVNKLTAKTAEERYQSAFGLKADLQKCLDQFNRRGKINDFAIGFNDVSEKFQIPQKIYGREQETRELLKQFESAVNGGSELALIAGYSGVGKSALAHEIQQPVLERQGYFCEGKFDQFQRHIPYSAIARACRGVARQILSEPDKALRQWKTRLIKSLGANAWIIIELAPELETVIGKQPKAPKLDFTETQNRFNITFRNFIKTIAGKKHPLVFFIDDLQWCDASSLNLIYDLAVSRDIKHFLLIGAYRDNEVSADHAFAMKLSEIKKNRPYKTINLPPLNCEAVGLMLTDAFKGGFGSRKQFADVIFRKTEGNPFFIKELLMNLKKNNTLVFNFKNHQFECDIKTLEKTAASDNVVELIIQKIKGCSPKAIQLLKLAACLGNSFDLKTLAMIAGDRAEVTAKNLMEIIEMDAVIPLTESYNILMFDDEKAEAVVVDSINPEYKFQHDRVQQAAYSLIEDAEKPFAHLSIGRSMAQNYSAGELDAKVIDIARQLNEGRSYISDKAERRDLAELNLLAGRKAKLSAAFSPALEYFIIGKELLDDSAWQQPYQTAFDLYFEYCECAYICGNFQQAERQSAFLIDNAKTILDKSEVYLMRGIQYSTMGELEKSIDMLLNGLKLLGINISPFPEESVIAGEMERVKAELRKHKIADLINLPEMKEPAQKMAMKLLTYTLHYGYVTGNEGLLISSIIKGVRTSLQYGNAPESAYMHNCYGFLLSHIFDDMKTGYEFGKLALALDDRFTDMKRKTSNLFIYTIFCQSWNSHPKEWENWYTKAIETGLETGDLLYTSYACINILPWNPEINLTSAIAEGEKYLAIIKKANYQDAVDMAMIHQHLRLNLIGKTFNAISLSSDAFDEEAALAGLKASKYSTGVATYYIYKSITCFYYEEYEAALRYVKEADKAIKALRGQPHIVDFCLYSFLTYAALSPGMQGDKKDEAWARLKKEYAQMKKWADYNPVNFNHFKYLMEAELARLSDEIVKAHNLYDQAIETAGKNGFPHFEALANEQAGKFWLSIGKEKFARVYLDEARYGYELWEAKRKVEYLDAKYLDILIKKNRNHPAGYNRAAFNEPYELNNHSAELLDFSTIMKAVQTLSSEIEMDKLISRIMEIAIENAGAERGLLILPEDNRWLIRAEGKAGTKVETLRNQNVSNSTKLSHAIFNYVARVKESVVLNDAAIDANFSTDPYIQDYGIKSLVCMPILNQQKLTGILYLENKLTDGAFTANRLKVVRILSAQAAISLQNAGLYDVLQREIAERIETQKELTKNKEQLQSIIDNSAAVIYIKDPEGRYLLINSRYEDIFHISQAEIKGKTDYDIFPKDTADMFRANDLKVLEINSHHESEEFAPHDDGFVHTYISVKFPLHDFSGNIYGICGILTDITARKSGEDLLKNYNLTLERKVEERTHELKIAKEKAEIASNSKSIFLTGMSHELRTPLNAILGFTQILKHEKDLMAQHGKAVNTIHYSADHLLTMINDILDLSKIEAGKIEVVAERFRLHEFIMTVVKMARIRADQNNVSFSYNLSNGLPIDVEADEKHLLQVLLNLIDNATKFSKNGRVILTVKKCNEFEPSPAQAITDTHSRDEANQRERVRFQVEDTGIGIAEEQQEEIFFQFHQVGDKRYQNEGSGLGLSISRDLARLMGSELYVKSSLGKGSVFWFDLNLLVINNANEPELKARRDIVGYHGKKRKLLIVDDIEDNRGVLQFMLQPLGFDTAEAINGRDAVEQASMLKPDLILLDLKMPVMDGFEAVEQLRKAGSGIEDVIVIAVSGAVSDKMRDDVIKKGFNDFISKPIIIDKLLDCIQQHLGLEWIYEENEEEAQKQDGGPIPIIPPPREALLTIHELSSNGNILGIRDWLKNSENLNEEHKPFFSNIKQFADVYALEKITKFVNSYLNSDDAEPK